MHNSQVGHVDNVKLVSGSYRTLANGPRSGAQNSGTVGHLNRGVLGLITPVFPRHGLLHEWVLRLNHNRAGLLYTWKCVLTAQENDKLSLGCQQIPHVFLKNANIMSQQK